MCYREFYAKSLPSFQRKRHPKTTKETSLQPTPSALKEMDQEKDKQKKPQVRQHAAPVLISIYSAKPHCADEPSVCCHSTTGDVKAVKHVAANNSPSLAMNTASRSPTGLPYGTLLPGPQSFEATNHMARTHMSSSHITFAHVNIYFTSPPQRHELFCLFCQKTSMFGSTLGYIKQKFSANPVRKLR